MWLRCCSFMLPISLVFFCYFFSLSFSALLRCSSLDILARLSDNLLISLAFFSSAYFNWFCLFFDFLTLCHGIFPQLNYERRVEENHKEKLSASLPHSFLLPLSLWLNLKILAYAVHARFTASPSPTHTETPCGVVASLVAKRTRKENNEWVHVGVCVCPCVCMRVCVSAKLQNRWRCLNVVFV